MKIKHLNWLFAALAFVASSSSTFNTAQAWFLRIDCQPGSLGPSSAAANTSDPIEIWVLVNGSYEFVQSLPPVSNACSTDFGFLSYGFPFRPASEVQSIWINKANQDMFWIDRVRLYNDSGSINKTWGTNGFTGWCLTYDQAQNAVFCNQLPQNGFDFDR